MRGLFACIPASCSLNGTYREGDIGRKGPCLRPCPSATKEHYVDCRDAGPPLIFFYCCTDVAGARSSTELTGRLPG